MTMRGAYRATTTVISRTPKGVIRAMAIGCAVLGFLLLAGVAYRNIRYTTPLPLGTMLWGIALFGFGCLVIQKGDVSLSVVEAIDGAVRLRRGVFGFLFRSSDPPPAPSYCSHCGKLMVFCICDDDSEPPVNDR